jgi:hypothetical protein
MLADAEALRPWFDARATLRRRHLPDGRRMSFKSLNDRLRVAALPEFLSAANLIPGLLLVVLFDKRIGTIFAPDDETQNAESALGQQLSQWPARTQEKLLRICHIAALMVASLSRELQNILWVTDQDDIAANVERHTLRRNDMRTFFETPSCSKRRYACCDRQESAAWLTPDRSDIWFAVFLGTSHTLLSPECVPWRSMQHLLDLT